MIVFGVGDDKSTCVEQLDLCSRPGIRLLSRARFRWFLCLRPVCLRASRAAAVFSRVDMRSECCGFGLVDWVLYPIIANEYVPNRAKG